ncbi:MAG: hypothetical protein A3H92_04180 [Rhodospirillales bacterium RIFCSPLOWO2_02_FULL_58_16]|nr:MAG: hypothetical protein A3H92_04180 [Rhodospirillales bacterium RIFCSPLOWO2_02_FULL_58_16]
MKSDAKASVERRNEAGVRQGATRRAGVFSGADGSIWSDNALTFKRKNHMQWGGILLFVVAVVATVYLISHMGLKTKPKDTPDDEKK